MRPEHEWFSRRALCLVLAKLERDGPEAATPRHANAIAALEALREGSEGPSDYGLLVAYADYVTFPNDMVDTAETGPRRISSVHVRRRISDAVAEYTELLRNPHHFRMLGVTQYHIWHDTAVSRALESAAPDRSMDPLWDALAYNAYADHFLEDFFAPGHMTQEPDGLSHMGNLRIHDTDNWTGRVLEPAPGVAEMLGALLGDTPEQREQTASRCFAPEEGVSVADLEDAAAATSIELKGDNQVYREGEGILEGRKRDALFVTLVVGRSILDVVQSYIDASPQNHFPNRRCPALPVYQEDEAPTPPAGDCYFVLDENEQNPYFAGIRAGSYRSDPDAERSALVWPSLGASMELQRIDGTSRWQTSLEMLFDLPSRRIFSLFRQSDEWTRHFSFELGVGYSYINKGILEGDSDYNGHGPDLRLYLRAKQLYMFAEAEVGWRFYHGEGHNIDNFRAAGRLGFGNGIFWAYGSLARDKRMTHTGGSWDSTLVGFGVSMTIPSTRLLDWAWGH